MIADWTVDVGPESPVIEVPWSGWIDLQLFFRIAQREGIELRLNEFTHYPEIRAAVRICNSTITGTSKMDVFPLTRDEVDAEITETAGIEITRHGLCSYLDCYLLRRGTGKDFDYFEGIARRAAERIRRPGPKAAGAEIVVRPAYIDDEQTYGWSLYAFAFGRDVDEARSTWASVALNVSWMFQLVVAMTA